MLIYGTGSKNLGTKRLQGVKSPYDETRDIEIVGVSRYAHVFWIPLFPFSKKVYPYCPGTEQEIAKADITPRIADKIKEAKKTMKTPVYLFAGVILLALLIGYLAYDDYQHDKQFAKNITDIKPTDVIVFKNEDATYSFAKVSTVIEDTIYLQISNYVYEGGTPSEYSLNKEKKDVEDFYNEEIYYFLKQTIDSMYQSGEVYDLYRQVE